jgi:sugar O-acyltransferase (sialic acid O-acetyltransferase NeuD family)
MRAENQGEDTYLVQKPKSPLLILGTGLFAEDVADIVMASNDWELAGFVEGMDRSRCARERRGRPVFWIDDVHKLASSHSAICAVGSTKRERLIEQARSAGIRFTKLLHPSAQVSASSTLDEGVIIGAGSVVGAQTHLGAHVLIGRGALIGHHVVVGSYSTVGPGCNIAAQCVIGAGTYLGIGAILIDRLRIGSGCLVGAGALVTRDLPDRVQAIGAPARVVKREIERF